MNRAIGRNLANLIVLVRIALVFVTLLFLGIDNVAFRIAGLFILILAAVLDGVDGYIARKQKIASQVGGLMDTLGDRITENLLMIFFACVRLIPVWVAVLFVGRSFLANFVRMLNFKDGVGTFQVSTSRLGHLFVSSIWSRAVYLILKIGLFISGCLVLILESPGVSAWRNGLQALRHAVFYGSILVLLINLFRFVLLVYDSRQILKRYVFSAHGNPSSRE